MSYSSVITVIPTFFNKNNEVDYNLILEHIEKQYLAGIKSIVILGTTSETPTLSLEEKLSIATYVYSKFHNDLQIIIGVGGFNTNDVVKEAQLFESFCDALMLSAPYYNKPSQEGLFQHFSQVISQTAKDYVLYNVPSRCGVNLEPETIARLANKFPQIKAIKEASGSIEQVIKIKSLCDIDILSGDDALTLPFMSLGAKGIISVVSNVIPNQMLEIVTCFNEGHHLEALNIFYKYYNLIKLCFIESNPVPVKYMLELKNHTSMSTVRLPLIQLSQESKEKIINYFQFNEVLV
jgi:4-hydroxy-tetrahydrodipicolinate synthase